MVLARTAMLCLSATLTLNPLEPPMSVAPQATGYIQASGARQFDPPAPTRDVAGTQHSPARATWSAPVGTPRLAAPYDPPSQPWLAGHRGVDLVTTPGQVVLAAGTGRIAFAGMVAGRGVLSIDHGGLRTTYEPVTTGRRVGDRVAAGEIVGRISTGTGHCGHGFCLHLGLRRGKQYLDPLLLIGHHRVLLRPW